jgi:Protein of unknown function (DUF2786)
MDSPIIEKIRKLHALAERAGTEHEAAVAAARVAELCRKHQLELGSVLIEEQEKEASRCWIAYKGSWRSYRSNLADAVCELLDLDWYRARHGFYDPWWHNRSFCGSWLIVFYGLKANTQAAEPTYRYFEKTISGMLRKARKAGLVEKGGRATRSFRMGCAQRIRDAARTAAAESAKANHSKETQALTRFSKKLKEELAQKLGLRPMYSNRWCSTDDNAFSVGYAAASKVNLRRSERLLES